MLTSTIDVIFEYDLADTSQEGQKLVNIGWGKKETQFRGMEGKKAVVPNLDSNLEGSFDKSPCITWRGDSSLLAVGFWCRISCKRRIKIFSKDGPFVCINEDMAGLDGPLSWRPQGNLIAFSQQLANKYVISFLEKNGLKHLDFELPKGFKVKHMSWNMDSNILCLLVKQSELTKTYLMLWTCSNYHWFLKQMFLLSFEVAKIIWDEDRENKLHLILRNGTFYEFEFSWIIDHSNYASFANKYYISVIDKETILLTPFHSSIIPPPMSKWTLKCPASVNQILYPPTYGDEECKYFMCALLCDGKFCFFSENSEEPYISRIDELFTQECFSDLTMHHWAWVTNTTIIGVSIFEGGRSKVMNIQIAEDKLELVNNSEINHHVIAVVANTKDVYMYLLDGRCIEYDIEKNSISEIKAGFPEPCYHVVAHSKDKYGLSEWNRLYKNGKTLSNNITSFLIHYPFILATTSNHTLLLMNSEGSEVEEISVRKLERGSKLVAVTGQTVIMQLPRGNLESIQPRALTIMNAGKLLDKKLYKEAIQLLRRQRISFDLCCDHNPSEFFANIKHFIQVVDPQWITLFVTELLPTDVTRGIYSQYYKQERQLIYPEEQKINKICITLLEALQSSEEEHKYMLPILSCLVKSRNIAEAIKLANSDQAMQHLLFLVDVDTLYNEALGSYNLEAALQIAGKSQMDPKEYIPFLNSLREMDSNYMKYEIDKMLRRQDSALRNLSKCGDDKLELMYSLIEEHQLYNLALDLFKSQPERFTEAANMYGDYLFKQASFEEAGVLYMRSNNLPKAINAFKKSGNWRKCMLLANRSNYSDIELRKLGDSLCNTLTSSHKFREAAEMYKDCFADTNKAIEIYLQGHLWEQALYIAETSGLNQLIEEAKNISVALLHLNSDEKGTTLQNNVEDFLKIIDDIKSDVWPKDPNENEIAVIDAKLKYPPDMNIDTHWKLAVFSEN
uniref:Uncharacterized protein n=1 Tax=Rhodnius prolixus TaxID=13249 RepID=T1HAY6_RHOPR